MTDDFTDARTFIGIMVNITIDRPLGSRHPEAGFIYPVNYGFIPKVPSPDREDIDAYILGVFKSIEACTGRCIVVIQRSDDDDKLVVIPAGRNYSEEQILALTEFQELFFESSVTRDVIAL